jgi:hypothetical protein
MIIAGVAMLLLLACNAPMQPIAPVPKETPTPLPDEFHAEMFSKRSQWRRQGMPHYRIYFEFIEDASKPVVTYREVFIGNYAVRGVRCPAGACPTTTFRDVETVADVFNLMQRIPQSCIVDVRYDPYLYYPSYLSADCAEGINHPFALRIARLVILN